MDFGLATVARDSDSLESTVDDRGTTARYTAPEILKGVGKHSRESDVFAFGMVVIEVGGDESIPCKLAYMLVQVFTGKAPFSESTAPAAIAAIIAGGRPKRSSHRNFTDSLWALTQQCWGDDPHGRPPMDQVIKQL